MNKSSGTKISKYGNPLPQELVKRSESAPCYLYQLLSRADSRVSSKKSDAEKLNQEQIPTSTPRSDSETESFVSVVALSQISEVDISLSSSLWNCNAQLLELSSTQTSSTSSSSPFDLSLPSSASSLGLSITSFSSEEEDKRPAKKMKK